MVKNNSNNYIFLFLLQFPIQIVTTIKLYFSFFEEKFQQKYGGY